MWLNLKPSSGIFFEYMLASWPFVLIIIIIIIQLTAKASNISCESSCTSSTTHSLNLLDEKEKIRRAKPATLSSLLVSWWCLWGPWDLAIPARRIISPILTLVSQKLLLSVRPETAFFQRDMKIAPPAPTFLRPSAALLFTTMCVKSEVSFIISQYPLHVVKDFFILLLSEILHQLSLVVYPVVDMV